MKHNKGLTLIRLFPVAAIIVILAVIAVPSYLGTFRKATARNDQGKAKVSMSEVIKAIEDIGGGPFTRLGSHMQSECFESSDAEFSGDTCQDMYSQSADSTCSAYPNGMIEFTCTEYARNNDTGVSE